MTEDAEFTDYYEVLEISPNANPGTIARMFRERARAALKIAFARMPPILENDSPGEKPNAFAHANL
jgi:hypothetical protein